MLSPLCLRSAKAYACALFLWVAAFAILSPAVRVALAAPPFKDYYAALELKPDASADDIRKAFRRLARKYHPDVNPNNPEMEEKFKEVSEANDILSDETKKKAYDYYCLHKDETRFEQLERFQRERGLTYFEAIEYSERKWATRSQGKTYEDAKTNFAINSYYFSEKVGEYDLTEEQKVAFAFQAASERGAVFTKLVQNYAIENPQSRFAIGIEAANRNSWSGVKFDIDAFELGAFPALRYELARAVVRRSEEQMNYVKEWGFSREERLDLLYLVAERQGVQVLKHLDLVRLTQNERSEIFRRAVLRDGVDAAKHFKAFGLTNRTLIFKAVRALALRDYSVGRYLKDFGITDPRQVAELAELNATLGVRQVAWRMGAGGFNLADAKIREYYFDFILPKDPAADPLYDLNRAVDADTAPAFSPWKNPLAVEHSSSNAALLGPLFGGQGPMGLSQDTYSVPYGQNAWEALRQFGRLSQEHPELFPPQWIDRVMVFGARDPDISLELLRQAYRLSTGRRYYEFSDINELLAKATGIEAARISKPYTYEARAELFRGVLGLHHEMRERQAIGFHFFEPSLYEPENIGKISEFTRVMSEEIARQARAQDRYRDYDQIWKETRKRYGLPEYTVSASKLTEVIAQVAAEQQAAQCSALMHKQKNFDGNELVLDPDEGELF